jgi:hypothetical protein
MTQESMYEVIKALELERDALARERNDLAATLDKLIMLIESVGERVEVILCNGESFIDEMTKLQHCCIVFECYGPIHTRDIKSFKRLHLVEVSYAHIPKP